MGTWFDARRTSRCARCKGEITEGDNAYRERAGVILCGACGQESELAAPAKGDIERAVCHDLSQYPEEEKVFETAFAQTAIYMARQLDQGDVSPREVTQYTKEIRLNLMQLADLFPPAAEGDDTDQAREKRERRMRERDGI